ncbi:MAG: hypothetical protein ACREV4_14945 [Gammaproteobacteria bacterium]
MSTKALATWVGIWAFMSISEPINCWLWLGAEFDPPICEVRDWLELSGTFAIILMVGAGLYATSVLWDERKETRQCLELGLPYNRMLLTMRGELEQAEREWKTSLECMKAQKEFIKDTDSA